MFIPNSVNIGVLIQKLRRDYYLTHKAIFYEGKRYSDPTTRHGGAWGERRYSFYSFFTSALDGGECSASRPGRALPPGKGPPVPIVQEAG
jgi:hypothetical protein